MRRGGGTEPLALLMIGHNPSFHETARAPDHMGEVEARERLNEGLPTAGLVVIDFAGDDWKSLHPRSGRLDRFVTPRLLDRRHRGELSEIPCGQVWAPRGGRSGPAGFPQAG